MRKSPLCLLSLLLIPSVGFAKEDTFKPKNLSTVQKLLKLARATNITEVTQ